MKASGGASERPGLIEALKYARKKDTLVVWKLYRLGRSLSHLLEIVEGLEERGVEFVSLPRWLRHCNASRKDGVLSVEYNNTYTAFERAKRIASTCQARYRDTVDVDANANHMKSIERAMISTDDFL